MGRALAEWENLMSVVGRPPSLNHAATAISAGDIDGAFEELDSAIHQQPENPVYLSARGHLELQLGFLRAAEVDFEQAIEMDPENAQAWSSLGRTRLELGLYVRAVRALEQAIHLGLDDAEHHILLARAFRGCGREEESALQYLAAFESWHANPTSELLFEVVSWASSTPGTIGPVGVCLRPFGFFKVVSDIDERFQPVGFDPNSLPFFERGKRLFDGLRADLRSSGGRRVGRR